MVKNNDKDLNASGNKDKKATTKVVPTKSSETKKPASKTPVAKVEKPKVEAKKTDKAKGIKKPELDKGTDTKKKAEPSKVQASNSNKNSAKKSAKSVGNPEPKETVTAKPAVSVTSLIFQAPDLPAVVQKRNTQKPQRKPQQQPPTQDSEASSESHLRRRSRRRAGEAIDVNSDEPNVVVKVRTPREPKEPSSEPTRIKGSTRLEAKKQRRRDGRDSGRRRSVITETEFLARRESVDRIMVVRSKDDKIQIGVLEDKVLVEHYVAKSQDGSLIGNVYMGKVQNVLPSMEAAFVDIGRGRNAVLYSGEVNWDASDIEGQPRKIELALKSGDTVLVQVTKDSVGQKGARLTSQVSLPGRFVVFVPNGSMNGISRKLPDSERARLKKILKEVLPEEASVIVRTAAEGATEEQITLDVKRLQAQWDSIVKKQKKAVPPTLLHSEPDLLVKIVRDVFNEDFQKMIISGDDARTTISDYLESVAPDLLERVEKYEGKDDIFDHYRVGEQIAKALDRKVYLPSGGSLVIDRTEAMTVVDVNTGKFVGSGGNLEETVTKNNLEAAEEIVRQLRLRDIGGIIVVDFIDMVLESNRDLVSRRLIECLGRDRTKHQVAEVTSLGLVQMTRKKLGLGLLEAFSEPCEACASRGVIVHHEPIMRSRPQVSESRPEKSNKRSKGQKHIDVAKVVTPERAEEINSVVAKIAASTMPKTLDSGAAKEANAPVSKESSKEQLLGNILDALPEAKPTLVRKSRRATSPGKVDAPVG
jgi:ribonuclease E